jgi:hypothetical protein
MGTCSRKQSFRCLMSARDGEDNRNSLPEITDYYSLQHKTTAAQSVLLETVTSETDQYIGL